MGRKGCMATTNWIAPVLLKDSVYELSENPELEKPHILETPNPKP